MTTATLAIETLRDDIAVSDIFMDDAYGRPLNERNLERLVREWDRSRVGVVYLSLRPDGMFACIDGEFDFSKSYAYRLVQQGQVVKALKAGISKVSPIGDDSDEIHISEYAARDIAPVLPQVTERVREQVAAGVAPQQAVAAVVREVREPIRRVSFDDGGFADDLPVRDVGHRHEWVCRGCGELREAE